MIKKNFAYMILALVFVALIGAGFLRGAKHEVSRIKEVRTENPSAGIRDIIDRNATEDNFATGPFKERDLIDLNGAMAKRVGMRGYYSDLGILAADNDYLVTIYPKTTTDFEYKQVVSFMKWCHKHNIKMLYVNKPTKYPTDEEMTKQFGIETFSNRNADKLMKRLRAADVPVVDLRDYIEEDGLTTWELFYRTDHHWTTKATLWAAPKIMKGLNDYCGYDIDLSIYDKKNYNFKEFKNCWLGEQGRKLGMSYTGLDDFTEITPKFPTHYTFKSEDGDFDGDFMGFINQDRFDTKMDIYENTSWHYGYKLMDCINHDAKQGKVLLLGDSFEQTLDSFISLGVHELDVMMRRDHGRKYDLRGYILKHGYDTVIISYAQLMIGAHDDPKSTNGKMFILK